MNCGQTVDKQQTSECKQLKLREKHENTFYDPHVNDGVMTPEQTEKKQKIIYH